MKSYLTQDKLLHFFFAGFFTFLFFALFNGYILQVAQYDNFNLLFGIPLVITLLAEIRERYLHKKQGRKYDMNDVVMSGFGAIIPSFIIYFSFIF